MSVICNNLHQILSKKEKISFPFNEKRIPKNGVYILFENGEIGHGEQRIVRVGTHTGNDQLPSRLEQHFLKENKDRSIFRKNIGRALLNKNGDPYAAIWEHKTTSREDKAKFGHLIDRKKQQQIEQMVTAYIQKNFQFIVFPIPEKDNRLFWEARIISTVSWCGECKPSSTWLGNYSPKEKIRQSGLWLVNELYKEPLSHAELERFQRIVS